MIAFILGVILHAAARLTIPTVPQEEAKAPNWAVAMGFASLALMTGGAVQMWFQAIAAPG